MVLNFVQSNTENQYNNICSISNICALQSHFDKSRASLLLDKAQVRTARRPTHTVRNPAAPFFLCARSMRPGPGPVATGTGRMVVGWHELGWHELGSRYECTGARTPERSAVPGARLLAGELADRKECISRVRLQPPRVCLNGSLLLGAWSSLWTTRALYGPRGRSPRLRRWHLRLLCLATRG